MLKPRQRLTRKQIKEDKLVTTYAKATRVFNENSKLFIGGGVIIILLVVGMSAIRSSRANAEVKASLELARGKTAYEAKDYDAAVDILRRAVEDYGGSNSGKLCYLYLANSLYEQGEYTEAKGFFKEFVDKMGSSKFMAKSGLAGIGACLEQSKDFTAAADYYVEAATDNPSKSYSAKYLLSAGRCFLLAGATQDALRLFNDVVERYPDSPDKNQAEVYIGELSTN